MDSIKNKPYTARYVFFMMYGLLGLCLLKGQQVHAQSKHTSLDWITFEDLSPKMREEPKSILITIGAPWCNYCHMQANTVFKNADIVETLQNQFYTLDLNAESEEDIPFMGKTYHFRPSGLNSGQHELAVLLGKENGILIFPTTLLLDSRLQLRWRHQGLVSVEQLKLAMEQVLSSP